MSKEKQYTSALPISASIMIAAICVMVTGIQPLMVGALLTDGRIDMTQVGQLIMTELLMLVIGIVIANTTQPIKYLRRTAIFVSVSGLILNYLSLLTTTSTELMIVRAGAGLAEGALLWVSISVVVRAQRASRLFAISSFVQLMLQAAVAAALSLFIIPKMGWKGVFVTLAAFSLINILASFLIPGKVHELPTEESGKFHWKFKHIKVLTIAFLQVATLGAIWSYLEPTGQAIGFSSTEIQSLISISLIAAMVGSLVSMFTIQRWSATPVIFLSSAAMAIIAALIYGTPSGGTTQFSVLLLTLQVVGLFVLPFQAAFAFSADATGRVATSVPIFQLLGQALGPLFASWFVLADDPKPSLLVGAVIASIAALLLLKIPGKEPSKATASNT